MGANKKKKQRETAEPPTQDKGINEIDHDTAGPRTQDKGTNEIEQIFLEGKKKKKRKEEEEKKDELPSAGSPANVPSVTSLSKRKSSEKDSTRKGSKKTKTQEERGSGGGKSFSDVLQRVSRKKTREGYTVYTEEELQWNNKNAGGTPLCPFDCDCCF